MRTWLGAGVAAGAVCSGAAGCAGAGESGLAAGAAFWLEPPLTLPLTQSALLLMSLPAPDTVLQPLTSATIIPSNKILSTVYPLKSCRMRTNAANCIHPFGTHPL